MSRFACIHARDKNQVESVQQNIFFPQHIVDGRLNSRRRVSDHPSWILISKTPARKSKMIIAFFLFIAQALKAELKAEPDFRYTNFSNLRRHPILATQTFLD